MSVILCAHNPREPVIARVFAALDAQLLPKDEWELVLVDNASNPPLKTRDWRVPDNVRWVVEPDLGLTPARLAGIAVAKGRVIVLIDDDTLPTSDYLRVALDLMDGRPEIGAAGGRIHGEFAEPPPTWAGGYLDLLALRDFGDRSIRALIYNEIGPWEPCGAGMVIRGEVARTYAARARDPRRRRLDRVGDALSSCGDTDLARTAPDLGMYLAYEPALRLTHVIPADRLRLDYFVRLTYTVQRDGWLLYRLRGRECDLTGWRLLTSLVALPFRSFSLSPRRWLLRAASMYGQIKGRSVLLENHD